MILGRLGMHRWSSTYLACARPCLAKDFFFFLRIKKEFLNAMTNLNIHVYMEISTYDKIREVEVVSEEHECFASPTCLLER